MPMQYRRAIRWVLYALMVMLAFLAQSVVFGSNVFFSFKLDLVAVAAISAALFVGAEKGSLFCLIVGVFYCFTGADMGPVTLVALTVCGALAGGACQAYFKKHLIPCALFSALALVLCDGSIFLLKLYFRQTQLPVLTETVLPGFAFSLLSVLLFFPISWLIARIGGDANG